jgi:hypothetical protein
MNQRVRCLECGEHRLYPKYSSCLSCGLNAYEAVTPTPMDVLELERKVVSVAEEIDTLLLSNVSIQPMSIPARRLADACRELLLARQGILAR